MAVRRVVAACLAVASVACATGEDGPRDGASRPPTEATADPAESTVATAPESVATDTSVGNRRERPTVVFIGTSLTAGYGLEATQAYPAIVGRMLDSLGYPVRIVNAGLSGETSAGALRRIDWVLNTPADVIVLETGANDGLRGIDIAAAKRNIQAILDRIRAVRPGARVLLVQMESPPNMGASYTTAFRAMFPELARRNGVELIPFLLEGVAGHAALNQPDGIHPNARGARIVAGNVVRALLGGPGLATREGSTPTGGR